MEMLKNKAKRYLVPVYESPQESNGNSVIQRCTVVVRQAVKLVAANDLEDAENRGGTGRCTRSRVERRIKDPGRVTLAIVKIKRSGAADGE
jgi:hypothetical protein